MSTAADVSAGESGGWVFTSLDDLHPHPRNYRTHTDEQLVHLMRSIELHGVYRNVVAARDLTLLAGHGVVLAARRLGLVEIPVRVLDVDPFDTRALQLLAGDNESAGLADVDDRALGDLLRDLASDDIGNLLSTGFDTLSLSALLMLTRPNSELADLSESDEWIGLPEFESGEHTPQIVIKFDSSDERDAFAATLGITHWIKRSSNGSWTTWLPERRRSDRTEIRFE